MKPKTGLPLHNRIFLGMALGIAGGIGLRLSGLSAEHVHAAARWVKPVGDVFMRFLFMTVIPIAVSALALGVAEIGDLRRIGRMGLRTLLFTVLVSSAAVLTGVGLVNSLKPGLSLSAENRRLLLERFPLPASATLSAGSGILETLVKIVPKNPFEDMVRAFDPSYDGGGILAVIFFALVLGIALASCPPEKTKSFRAALEGLYEVMMRVISMGMRFAPIGVFALLFCASATMGFAVVNILFKYVAVVLAGLLLHLFGTYSALLAFFGRMRPSVFFQKTTDVMLVAFSTSSSNATLPTTLRAASEGFKLKREVSRFVLTLGATANQNGTALYEGVTVLFLAQCFGISMSWAQQVFIVVLCVLAGVGTAGVPGGSLPAVIMILAGIGVPAESMGIILGVDRLLDMSRTVVNAEGDLVAAVVIDRYERGPAKRPR